MQRNDLVRGRAGGAGRHRPRRLPYRRKLGLLPGDYRNLLIADFIVENLSIYAAGYEADSPENDLKIFVFDAADFSAVSLVGKYSNESLAVNPQSAGLDMLKVGDFLYVASPGNGLFVVDVSDPAAPDASLLFEGDRLTALAAGDGSTMYIGYSDQSGSPTGIHIADISDPANPGIVNTINNVPATDLLYEDGLLYVYGLGIAVMDASSADDLLPMGNVSFAAGSNTEIAYRNGFVYAPITDTAAGLQGMTIVDVRDPQNPQRIDDIAGMGFITEIAIHEQTLYATVSTGSSFSYMLVSFEIGADGKLEVIDSRSSPVAFHVQYEMVAIAVRDSTAYTVIGRFSDVTIGVFDVGDPAAPVVVHDAPYPFPLGDIAINNTTLYGVAAGPDSRSFYTIGTESGPEHLSTMDLLARALELEGSYVYTTSGTAGLSILNVADERDPVLFGGTLSLGIGNAVSVAGDVAYVANEFGMVEVYDILDKTHPALVGQYPISGVVKDVFATDDYVYAVNGFGLVIEPAVRLHSALQ